MSTIFNSEVDKNTPKAVFGMPSTQAFLKLVVVGPALLAAAVMLSGCGGGGGSSGGTTTSPTTPTPVTPPTPVTCNYSSTSDGVLVSNVADLQAALTTAGGNGADDTIYLAAGTYKPSATLKYDSKGKIEKISIIGCGKSNTIVDGGGSIRVFHFMKNGVIQDWQGSLIHIAPYPSLLIKGITVKNGNDSGDFNKYGKHGGGALVERFNTELNSVEFSGNTSQIIGGGVEGPADLVVKSSEFLNNYATQGGTSISACGKIDIEESNFIDGKSSDLYSGAAVSREICIEYNYSKLPISIKRSKFSGNRSGLYVVGGYGISPGELGSVEILDSTFEKSGRTAVDLIEAGNLSIKGSNFTDNGPWAEINKPSNCVDYDTNCQSGGAIWDRSGGGAWKIVDTNFIRNFALDYGGAIDRLGSVRCVDRTALCDPTRRPANDYDIDLENVVFDGNRSHRGAAISMARLNAFKYGFQNGNLKIKNVTLRNNIGKNSTSPGSKTPTDEVQTSVVVIGGNLLDCGTTESGNSADTIQLIKGNINRQC